MTRPTAADGALLGAAVLYGTTFLLVKDGVEDLTPSGFIALRFTLAAALLAPFAARAAHREGVSARPLFGVSVPPSIALFVGYLTQTAGLRSTTSSVSAFLTGLYSVFTPLLLAARRHRLPDGRTLVGLSGAVLGLYLLTGADLQAGRGEVLTLVCAVAFAVWIILQDEPLRRFPPVPFVAVQILFVAVLSWPVVAVTGLGELTAAALAAVVATAVAATVVAFVLQLWGQARVGAARAAMLLLLEPVVAGLLGGAAGERLGLVGLAGAVVILASILVVETSPSGSGSPPAVPPGAGVAEAGGTEPH